MRATFRFTIQKLPIVVENGKGLLTRQLMPLCFQSSPFIARVSLLLGMMPPKPRLYSSSQTKNDSKVARKQSGSASQAKLLLETQQANRSLASTSHRTASIS